MLPTEFDSEALELGVLALDKREQSVFLHGEVGLNGLLEHALYVPGTFSPIFRQQGFEGRGTVVPQALRQDKYPEVLAGQRYEGWVSFHRWARFAQPSLGASAMASSNFAARMKSLSVRPLILWVQISARTLPHAR